MTSAAASQPKLVDTKSSATLSVPKTSSMEILLRMIAPSLTNRRADPTADFIASIKESGVTADILVRPVTATEEHVILSKPVGTFAVGDSIYEIVFGERRYRASIANNFDRIPAKVRELSDLEALKLQVDENEQRENLSAMDRCLSYKNIRDQLMKDHAGERGYTETKCVAEVSEIVKKEVRTVYQILALTKLHNFLQDALNYGEMEASHGYEICRLEPDQQQQVLKWLRKETQHSQGDVPSVRRLKREIIQMQTVWDEQKRQAALPLEGAGDEVQKPAAQDAVNKAIAEYRPPIAAQLKKKDAAAAKEIAANLKAQRDATRQRAITKKYKLEFFTALASKVHISSRMLTHVVPNLIFEIWDINDLPVDGFAQNLLGWPAPKQGDRYTYEEISAHAKKHTRKFTPKLLAALVITLNMQPKEAEQLGKYYGVNPKQLLKKATAEVKTEERLAKKKGAA